MVQIATSGTPGDKSYLAVVQDLPVEAMIAIATDPDRRARSSILDRREIPEAVIAAALTRYPLDAPDFSAHWSAPPLLMESAPLAHLLDDMLQGYFDQTASPPECQEVVWRLRDEAMGVGNEVLTLGQASWIASQQTQR